MDWKTFGDDTPANGKPCWVITYGGTDSRDPWGPVRFVFRSDFMWIILDPTKGRFIAFDPEENDLWHYADPPALPEINDSHNP